MENKELVQIRKKIDKIDETLMSLLDKRADLVSIVGEIKFRENLPILNKAREEGILSEARNYENNEYVCSVFMKIIEESKKLQEEKWKLE